MSPFFLPFNGTTNFQLTSVDVESSPVFYDKAPPNSSLTLTLDSATGAGTLTSKNNFIGVNSIYVGVRSTVNDGLDRSIRRPGAAGSGIAAGADDDRPG